MFCVVAGALSPIAFSANTLNTYSDFSFKLSIQYFRQYESNVTTLVHLIVEVSVASRFSTKYPVISDPPFVNGGSHSIVTLLLVIAVARRFCGGEGGANLILRKNEIK